MNVAKRYDILNVLFDLGDYRMVMNRVEQWKLHGEHHYITLTPPYSVLMCFHNDELKESTKGADLTLPDGVGIILAAEILRYPHCGRVAGPRLMLNLCDWGRRRGYRHFFYGGAEDVANRLAERLCAKYPNLQVAGTYCPPFRSLTEKEDKGIVENINSTEPDIVWVGLGSPKQEIWMREHVAKISASALIGVGAAFDFHSGRVKWAPYWVQNAGLEWAYRLAMEPKRMWHRNAFSFVFLAKVIHQLLYSSNNTTAHSQT